MPRDFKNFSQNSKNTKNLSSEEQKKVNEYKNIYDKYKNMDNDELMSSLFKEANRLKSEGKLDNNSLNSLKSTLSPFLNQEQQQMLNNLVNMIKE